ncbi:MAG TPA: PAS domain S-box protein, partial [Burkholderiaceae bacterium]|nr:PAS domain S-box protein [Burkholderiaceae bacterium]
MKVWKMQKIQKMDEKAIQHSIRLGFGMTLMVLFLIAGVALNSMAHSAAAFGVIAGSVALLLFSLALLYGRIRWLRRGRLADDRSLHDVQELLLKVGALQHAIFNSANFSCIATDAQGVIQIFNVGAERMLGYQAADVVDQITPAGISDAQEVIARAEALSRELDTRITPGFEALVFKASRGIEDIYELTYIRKDGSRFPAIVSVTALRDAQKKVIGYLLIGTDNTARKQVEVEQ